MGISEVLQLICGLALFLYGMEVMGESLKKSAGSSLKTILGKMTSNPFKGFLLGLGVTCVIQSSSATTVMVVGFVNSGTMTLLQSVGVIMGANVGTAVTAWLTALSGLGGDEGADAVAALEWLKPDAWMPILALIGICLVMFVKRGKKRDIGAVLLGFAVLMTGMDIMSSSVSGLKSDEGFKAILTMFDNPILGVLAGLILTAIVQSSSASVGILQSLTVTGAITYGAAIPIVMGQNIGTCVTALISSIGANKNGRRAAVIHLYFNIIGVAIWLSLFYLFNSLIIPGGFPFVDKPTNMWDIAIIHTVFKILSVIAIAPFYKLLEKLSRLTIKDDPAEQESANLLDERLFETPSVAVGRATEVTASMAEISCKAMVDAMSLFDSFDLKLADSIRDLETKADVYEDTLGTYLVKLSARDLSDRDSKQVTKLLHIIGDLERISDHAVNILESAEEMKEKKIEFSAEAKRELSVLRAAVKETIDLTERSFKTNDVNLAANIEPLEQVVDDLKDTIKRNHIIRLQKSECSIEHGFILADLLNNFERVSDHCSNIGGCVIEISSFDAMDLHKYLANIKQGSKVYEEKYKEYKATYSLVG
ncbi:MAG: Na/Pi cotransporter family protein [Clostridia bacterium]|nr:Na/Pi cotransporter family protein [Clostridia bacterium]